MSVILRLGCKKHERKTRLSIPHIVSPFVNHNIFRKALDIFHLWMYNHIRQVEYRLRSEYFVKARNIGTFELWFYDGI